jgi:AcrR family transcriptional regulator
MSTSAELNRADHAARPEESDTAARILDAALSLYLEFGLRRTTMDDVARQAGIGRVTVYRHYADKNALFQAVVLRECWRSIHEIEAKLAAITDPEARIVESFVLVVNGSRRHPLMRRLLDTEPEWLLPHLTIKGGPIIDFGRNYIARYLRHQRGKDNADVMAEIFMRILNSLLLTPGGVLAPENEDELREAARRFFLPLFHQQK